MLTTDADDAVSINLDAISPSLRLKIAELYREFAEGSRLLNQPDLAAHCERQASALTYGGASPLAALLEGVEP